MYAIGGAVSSSRYPTPVLPAIPRGQPTKTTASTGLEGALRANRGCTPAIAVNAIGVSRSRGRFMPGRLVSRWKLMLRGQAVAFAMQSLSQSSVNLLPFDGTGTWSRRRALWRDGATSALWNSHCAMRWLSTVLLFPLARLLPPPNRAPSEGTLGRTPGRPPRHETRGTS